MKQPTTLPAITPELVRESYRLAFYGEIDRRRAEGVQKRAESGRPNYRPPLGYKLVGTGKNQWVDIDEEAVVYVREAFRLAAAGWSLRRILTKLTEQGMRSARGKDMSPIALSKILRNRFYVGEIWFQESWLAGRHLPLIDEETFRRVQDR
ncbi:MAG: hypothetical protein NVSMB52_16180 [Chloroflexota bacterium]